MSTEQYGKEVFLKKLISLIDANLENERFGVSELAREIGMSRSNLHRKVKSIAGKSVSQLIREIRLEKARELLNKGEFNVSEIAYRVGFGSATYFSKCFHDHYGYPPGEAAEHDTVESSQDKSPSAHNLLVSGKRRFPLPWVITAIVAILAVILLILNLQPSSSKDSASNPVIAVLPFHNDSPEQQNAYMVNGLMEEILNKLSLVKELNVISRTSSEAYRNSDKSLREIGRELQASHILEGSATILNNSTRIRLQLIETSTDQHLWSKPYEREINLENLFEVQEEVALAVTTELRLVLNREEQEMILVLPTDNLEAYDAFLQARELLNFIELKGEGDYSPNQMKAKQLLERAIELDSSFHGAYARLASIYIGQFYFHELGQNIDHAYACLDTGRLFAEKALSIYEKKSSGSLLGDEGYHWAKGQLAAYYRLHGEHTKAEQLHREGMKDMPMDYGSYVSNIWWYYFVNDFAAVLENYLKYLEAKPEDLLMGYNLHGTMYNVYSGAGFPEYARQHSEQMLMREEDGVRDYVRMRAMEKWQGNYLEASKSLEWLTEWDTVFSWKYWLEDRIWHYACMGEINKAIDVTRQGMEGMKLKGEEIESSSIVAYVYMIQGENLKAASLLDGVIEKLNKDLEYPTMDTQVGYNHLHLARVYSILGDKENTLINLAPLKDIPGVHICLISELRDWPSYDLVRDTREFKEIYSLLEKRYQKEHEQIARLLEKDHSFN